jgi:hypothetical protein
MGTMETYKVINWCAACYPLSDVLPPPDIIDGQILHNFIFKRKIYLKKMV